MLGEGRYNTHSVELNGFSGTSKRAQMLQESAPVELPWIVNGLLRNRQIGVSAGEEIGIISRQGVE